MSAQVKCFLLTESDRVQVYLRRFVSSIKASCPLQFGYHNAETLIDEREHTGELVAGDTHPHDDPRWPKACACGHVFDESDDWQHHVQRLYARSDGGPLTTLRHAPPGAMWDAHWYTSMKGPDGRTLVVRLPNGFDWVVDGPASNGQGWARTGQPPIVTATPSILAGEGARQYHGWLRDGVLIAC